MNIRSCSIAAALIAATTLAHARTPPAASRADSFQGHPRAAVLLLTGPKGLVAITADRRWSTTLAAGEIAQAAFDPVLELAWIVRGDRLEVIDLREAAPKPVVIARSYPGSRNFTVIRDEDDAHAASSGALSVAEIVVHWQDTPSIDARTGNDEIRAEIEAEAKKIRLVGTAWLGAQRQRKAVEAPEVRRPARDPKFQLPEGIGRCPGDTGQEGMCGTSVDFASADWKLVIQSIDCGSFVCETGCVLVDGKGRLASPLDTTAWSTKVPQPAACHPYRFDRAGRHYAIGARLCAVSGPCVKLDGRALGWLASGVMIEPN